MVFIRISKYLVLSLFAAVLVTLAVASQIGQTPKAVSLEERQDCTMTYYNETSNVYGNVSRARNTKTTCFDSVNQSYYTCINGTETYRSYELIGTNTTLKQKTDCKSLNSYVISVDTHGGIRKKEIDFSDWGVCIHSVEDNCLAITCGTMKGGSARNGIFNGCDGGKSCQKFLFCEDETKVLYKGSKSGFAEEDPTFHIDKLPYKEAAR